MFKNKFSNFERISTLEDNLASRWSVVLCIDFIEWGKLVVLER